MHCALETDRSLTISNQSHYHLSDNIKFLIVRKRAQKATHNRNYLLCWACWSEAEAWLFVSAGRFFSIRFDGVIYPLLFVLLLESPTQGDALPFLGLSHLTLLQAVSMVLPQSISAGCFECLMI